MITLTNGPTVPDDALATLLDVEAACVAAGQPSDQVFTLSKRGLFVRPLSALDDDLKARITRWKPHLMALVTYVHTRQ